MILAVLQARTSSSRLPGKVLLPLAGAPMLARQIERLQRARSLDKLIVATSDRAEDDRVASVAIEAGVGAYRGSLNDVLDRFYRAAAPHSPTWIVRLTGDCPLADWSVIDDCVRFAQQGDYDYASNTLEPTWPDGLDVEVIRFAALKTAWREAQSLPEREHVTLFVNRRAERFKLGSVRGDPDLSHLRWTVDEPSDYAFVARVYDALYPANPAFTTADILALIDREPELARLNAGIGRNEGLLASEQQTLRNGPDD